MGRARYARSSTGSIIPTVISAASRAVRVSERAGLSLEVFMPASLNS